MLVSVSSRNLKLYISRQSFSFSFVFSAHNFEWEYQCAHDNDWRERCRSHQRGLANDIHTSNNEGMIGRVISNWIHYVNALRDYKHQPRIIDTNKREMHALSYLQLVSNLVVYICFILSVRLIIYRSRIDSVPSTFISYIGHLTVNEYSN